MFSIRRKLDSFRKQEREEHESLPWISSPFKGVDLNDISFHQRHEANPAELFFDLFFVANLATFTAYHSITDAQSLWSYVGFFTILWSSWFQITLYDVRFSTDSIFERVCKVLQFLCFVSFAYIGGNFDPAKNRGESPLFWTTCTTLGFTAMLQAVQYGVVLYYAVQNGAVELYKPLGIIIGTFVVSGIVDTSMIAVFSKASPEVSSQLDDVFYGTVVLEVLVVLGVSTYWRALSFKNSHISERMGLLTLIVIGEGAIGVTKTVTKMMGKTGVDFENSTIVACIILILVFIWVLYFDNQTERHYGTIRQQIFCLLHFPLHLSIVAVVEGSQQVALARWTLRGISSFTSSLREHCIQENLNGAALVDALQSDLATFRLTEDKGYEYILKALEKVRSNSGLCSPDYLHSIDHTMQSVPPALNDLLYTFWTTLYHSLGFKLAPDADAVSVSISAWTTIYAYFWAGLVILLACFAIFLALTRRWRHDIFDVFSIGGRIAVVATAFAILLAGKLNETFRAHYLGSFWVLPTAVILFSGVIWLDRIGRRVANSRLRSRAQESGDGSGEDAGVEAVGKRAWFGGLGGPQGKKGEMVIVHMTPTPSVSRLSRVWKPTTVKATKTPSKKDSYYGDDGDDSLW